MPFLYNSLIRNLETKYTWKIKDALTDLFKALQNEIHDVMDELGEPRDQYHISIYPFAIERLDGEPVPDRLLLAIKEKLQANS
jgi:hypothetical protein